MSRQNYAIMSADQREAAFKEWLNNAKSHNGKGFSEMTKKNYISTLKANPATFPLPNNYESFFELGSIQKVLEQYRNIKETEESSPSESRSIDFAPATLQYIKFLHGDDGWTSAKEQEAAFSQWMARPVNRNGKTFSKKTIDNYRNTLKVSLGKQLFADSPVTNLFDIRDTEYLSALLNALRKDPKYSGFIKEDHNTLTAALPLYISFIQSGTKEHAMTAEKREEAFKTWMGKQKKTSGQQYIETTSKSYAAALRNTLRNHPEFDGIQARNLFEISDATKFKAIQEAVLGHPKYGEFNATDHTRFSSAMDMYLEFLGACADGGPTESVKFAPAEFVPFLAAVRTKPFVLLAGISGTGKSRIVRRLALATCPTTGELAPKEEGNWKPGNFELIQVRPNWHDSAELLGYVSRVSGTPKYVMTDFVAFLVKAWRNPRVPFFVCLDEMNLAPVEQYFAEYLSVLETRRKKAGQDISSDVLVKFPKEEDAKADLLQKIKGLGHVSDGSNELFERIGGIPLPPNLIVMGTVNMDETTFSFSRKVLDRAMSIELNEVDLRKGLSESDDPGPVDPEAALASHVEAKEFYEKAKEECDKTLEALELVNGALEGTPFKIAYRSRNEIMLYVLEREKDGADLVTALDEAISMKILSRIEGDEKKVRGILDKLPTTLADAKVLNCPGGENGEKYKGTVCGKKLEQMKTQLGDGFGYVSFWC